jgi:hypothetical protein
MAFWAFSHDPGRGTGSSIEDSYSASIPPPALKNGSYSANSMVKVRKVSLFTPTIEYKKGAASAAPQSR